MSSDFHKFITFIIFVIFPGLSFAGNLTTRCDVIRAFGGASIGATAEVSIPPRNFDLTRWWREHCRYEPNDFKINGEIDSDLESSMRIALAYLTSVRAKIIQEHQIGALFWVESEGGDVETAMRIGRMLRSINASVWLRSGARCYSSCVFLIAGGVQRTTSLGAIGIHRPYFGSMGRNIPPAEVRNRMNTIDNLIVRFLQEMNVPVALLHAMKSVRPEDIQILSEYDVQRFMLNSPDPVWDELVVAREAWKYGTSSAEFRRRRTIVESRCFAVPVNQNTSRCVEAGYWGISANDYRARQELKESICWSRFRSRGTQMSPREIEDAQTCERDVMLGVRR